MSKHNLKAAVNSIRNNCVFFFKEKQQYTFQVFMIKNEKVLEADYATTMTLANEREVVALFLGT